MGVVLVGLVVAWALRSDETPAVATIGEPAPAFTVPVIGGGQFDLADHMSADGRPLILNQWASWCLPCREEIPAISAFSESNPQVAVLGVAVEDTETAATEFALEIGASYDLALGDSSFEAAYPRLGLPVTYVIDDSGVVTEIFNGIVTEQVLEDLVSG